VRLTRLSLRNTPLYTRTEALQNWATRLALDRMSNNVACYRSGVLQWYCTHGQIKTPINPNVGYWESNGDWQRCSMHTRRQRHTSNNSSNLDYYGLCRRHRLCTIFRLDVDSVDVEESGIRAPHIVITSTRAHIMQSYSAKEMVPGIVSKDIEFTCRVRSAQLKHPKLMNG